MPARNHIYVDDDKKGTVTVYDDDARLVERKFTYSGLSQRMDARKKAESFAAGTAARLSIGWGCNYEGRLV